MVSNRIKLIASLLSKSDKVLDVGTDHALLPIYLIKNDMVELADASDISSNVLINAKNNLSKSNLSNKINLYLSDGLKSIDVSRYNTLVICGMGYYTIRDILMDSNLETINKMIIQTNNHYSDFRTFIVSIGYKIKEEIWIQDQGIDYLIFNIEKRLQKLSNEEILCGVYNEKNIKYYENEIKKYEEVLKSIPNNLSNKINDINIIVDIYKSYLSREKTEEKN